MVKIAKSRCRIVNQCEIVYHKLYMHLNATQMLALKIGIDLD